MQLRIERLGGLAGMGAPQSRLKSGAEVDTEQLAPHDRQALQDLFDATARPGRPRPDAFRYRLTLEKPDGPQVVEVAEEHVPDAVRRMVRTQIV